MHPTCSVAPAHPGPVLCIVGGGFSGVAVAWHLLRTLRQPAQIVLIGKEPQLGRGLAYGTVSPHHLLNVPAGRMGIDPEDEAGFLRYLQQNGLPHSGGDFVARNLYSAYLEHALGVAKVQGASRGLVLEVRQAAVTDIAARADGGYRVRWDGCGLLDADRVVMALGNFDPQLPCTQNGLRWTEPGLFASAWDPRGLRQSTPDGEVLLVGSGLTAFDALLELRNLGHRGQVTMLSRRGLLAKFHRRLETPPPQGVVDLDCMRGLTSVRALLREVRALAGTAQRAGHDWRDVIGGMRPITPQLWQQLPVGERRRFLRHLLPYWDTHRHRASVPIGATIEQELQAGSLQLVAGRLRGLEPAGTAWRASIQPRGARAPLARDFAAVINCTGPSSDLQLTQDPLIQSLLRKGCLRPDALCLGVEVDARLQLLNADGQTQEDLYYIGPLLKATYWEATAVPELRVHARQLAATIGASLVR